MKISDNAKKFADRHVPRNCADGSYNQDTWDWYYRLYFRFVEFHLDKCLSMGIRENAFGMQGILEERAIDWVYEHPNQHNERGALCFGDDTRMMQLYIEALKEL